VLYDRGLRRTGTLVALGGGVIGDLGGFVAATYQRGVGFVQAPTTLLAQVDASVGGKVAVDFRAGKNYVGSFYQPNLVLADLRTLRTLPERELRSGAAEVAKHGLLAGGAVLRQAQRLARGRLTADAVTQALVADSIAYKAGVVERDEREAGLRAVLNLGHTIGHAIEAAAGFRRWSHGEAVGLGLHGALRLSAELAGLPEADERAGHELLDGLGLPARLTGAPAQDVCELIARDKKAGADGVGYVLLRRPGSPLLGVRVPPALELEVVEWLRKR
jgi:3-dehydroquinate synthase